MAGTPAGAPEPAPFAQVVGGTVTGPEQHANTVLVGLGWLSMLMHNRCSSDAETPSTNSQLEPFYSALDALVALAERADKLERERDEARRNADGMARLLVDMGEALRGVCDDTACDDPNCPCSAGKVAALLARLDALGKDTA